MMNELSLLLLLRGWNRIPFRKDSGGKVIYMLATRWYQSNDLNMAVLESGNDSLFRL